MNDEKVDQINLEKNLSKYYEWLCYVVYRVQIESGARTKILNTRKLKETFPWLETGKSKIINP